MNIMTSTIRFNESNIGLVREVLGALGYVIGDIERNESDGVILVRFGPNYPSENKSETRILTEMRIVVDSKKNAITLEPV